MALMVAGRFRVLVEWRQEATMIPEAKLAQVATDLHQRVAEYQLKREKQEQMGVLAKQDIQKPTFSDGLWGRLTAWLSTSQVRPNEKVSRVITERG